MRGLHLTADLYRCRCDPAWLADPARLGDWCSAALGGVGLVAEAQLFHAFAAGGVAVTLLPAQARLGVRTWPDERGVSIDVFVGAGEERHAARARGLMEALVGRFQPEWTEQRSLDRGDEA